MNIVYLTWGETPRCYGVFYSQVLKQFLATKREVENGNFHFLSGVPLIHSGMVREKWKYFSELKNIRRNLESEDISFDILPIFTSQNFVNSSKKTFKFMHFGSSFFLKNKLKKLKPNIVHCRSYHAAWAALKVRDIYGFSYKVVFDARGLWPEEISLKKGYNHDDSNYLFLKDIEEQILKSCDIVVSVSDTMAKIYESDNDIKSKVIYLSSDKFKLDTLPPIRKGVTFGYVGALDELTWHKPKELLKLYRKLRTFVEQPKIIIVTTSDHNAIEKTFSEFSKCEVEIVSAKDFAEVGIYLSKMDLGLMSYFKPSSPRELKLASTVLAVKTAEYLSAGLPVIVNKYCGGAENIVNQFDVGLSYDPDNIENINRDDLLELLDNSVKERAKKISNDKFDYKSNALRYKDIYSSLMF